MIKHCLLAGAFFALAVSINAAEKKSIADSIVYEKPTEWKVFASGTPVSAFTLHKDNMWYVTKDNLVSSSMKKSEIAKYPTLGSIPATDLTCIAVDQTGRIWVGGKNGIAVKSGTTFTNYTAESGLPDNNVNSIVVGNDGSVWVGTDNGVGVFQNNAWKVYKSTDGLAGDKATAMVVDNNGAIWIGSDRGISVYSGGSFAIHNMKKGMSWNNVKALAVDPKTNMIWAAVGEKDVNSFDGATWKTYMDIQSDLSSIMVDTHSRVWFGSASGIMKFNGEEWISDPKQLGLPANQVNAMLRDAGGNLWFAMENGVVRLSNPYPY
jgi:ligand-binding sensor domain-containing protein